MDWSRPDFRCIRAGDKKIKLSKKVKNGKISMELLVSGFAKEQNKKAPPGFVKMTI